MSIAWGKIGAWAADAEREEAEERMASAQASTIEPQSFLSLKESVTKTTKKKKMSMTLSEFNSATYVGPGRGSIRDSSLNHKGLTPDEMLSLPNGPKVRSAEEMQYGRHGGGFSSYGRASFTREKDGATDSSRDWSRRHFGGFNDLDRTRISRVSDSDMPSRADEVDNWASAKKSMPLHSADSGQHNRYAAGDGFSRADGVDNWAHGKAPIPVRSSIFSSGFRDTGPAPDTWIREGSQDVVKVNKPNPFGSARPREDVLSEKGLNWKKLDMELEAKITISRPTSSHSSRPSSTSRPSSAQSSISESFGDGMVMKSRPKINPFGEAKPREILLEEKGIDWRKLDRELEHRRHIDRSETEAEKILKEEIEQLKNTVDGSMQIPPSVEQRHIHDLLIRKQKDLEQLIQDLDEKVRFDPPKSFSRPGSGGGGIRTPRFPERSHFGFFEESRNKKPQSDSFPERGIIGNRGIERSRSRDRW